MPSMYWECPECEYSNRGNNGRCYNCGYERTDDDDMSDDSDVSIMEGAETETRIVPRTETNPQLDLITPADNLPIARGYGIEIECNWSSAFNDAPELAYLIAQKLTDAGKPTRVTNPDDYLSRLSNGWAVGEDGTCGAEVKSPILYNGAGLSDVSNMVEAMREIGCRTDARCGIHVHSDVREWGTDARPYKNLAALVARVESAIWAICPDRQGGTYCRDHNAAVLRKMYHANSMADILRAWYRTDYLGDAVYNARNHGHDSRYFAANFHSAFYRGSLEWRYFPSTTRAETVTSYVALAVALTEYAHKAKRIRFKSNARGHIRNFRKLHDRQLTAICAVLPKPIIRSIRNLLSHGGA